MSIRTNAIRLVHYVGTHGLRHSTSDIYLSHGATEEDINKLFEHSSMEVTKRYVHEKTRKCSTFSS
jgi:site-specific recombinase XerD